MMLTVLLLPSCTGRADQLIDQILERSTRLLEVLACAMRCPGHTPHVAAACVAAAAAGVSVHAPPCSQPGDCMGVIAAWKHYCGQHHGRVTPGCDAAW